MTNAPQTGNLNHPPGKLNLKKRRTTALERNAVKKKAACDSFLFSESGAAKFIFFCRHGKFFFY
jgi:hypothetical protein